MKGCRPVSPLSRPIASITAIATMHVLLLLTSWVCFNASVLIFDCWNKFSCHKSIMNFCGKNIKLHYQSFNWSLQCSEHFSFSKLVVLVTTFLFWLSLMSLLSSCLKALIRLVANYQPCTKQQTEKKVSMHLAALEPPHSPQERNRD